MIMKFGDELECISYDYSVHCEGLCLVNGMVCIMRKLCYRGRKWWFSSLIVVAFAYSNVAHIKLQLFCI